MEPKVGPRRARVPDRRSKSRPRRFARGAMRGGALARQACGVIGWGEWKQGAPWTVGLEEEVMLLEPDGSPAWRSEDVLKALPPRLAEHARGETHGLALELATNPHASVAAACSELQFMRAS